MSYMNGEQDIMLADDDREEVLIFETALRELNTPYILRHAVDGDALFVLLKDKVPQVLFLDITMPCKDGVACIREIRQHREYDNLPIVMYTSHLSNKIINDCYMSGANLYMSKTYTFGALVRNLRTILSTDWSNYMHYPSRSQFVMES